MTAKVSLQMQAEGIDEVVRALDKIPKSLQKQVLAGSAVGKQFKKMELAAGGASKKIVKSLKKQTDSIDNVKTAVKGMITSYIGMAGAQRVIESVNEQIKIQLKFLKDLGVEAKRVQDLSFSAKGQFINNFGAIDPNTINQLQGVIQRQGLGKNQTAGSLITTLTEVKSGTTGIDISEGKIVNAIELASKLERIDKKTQLAPTAIAFLTTQQAIGENTKGFSLIDAANFNKAVAEFGSLDASSVADPLAKALTSKEFNMSPAVAGLLLSRLPNLTRDPTGQRSGESITRFSTRFQLAQSFPFGKGKQRFESDQSGEKILEFIKFFSDKKIKGEDISTDLIVALKSIGIGEANDQTALAGLVREQAEGTLGPKLDKLVLLSKGGQASEIDKGLRDLQTAAPLGFKQNEIERQERGKLEMSRLRDINDAERERRRLSGISVMETLGFKGDEELTGFFSSFFPDTDMGERLELFQQRLGKKENLTGDERRDLVKRKAFELSSSFRADQQGGFLGSAVSDFLFAKRETISGLSIENQAKLNIRLGQVDPRDGLDLFEQTNLREAGVSEENLTKMQEMFQKGLSKELGELFGQIKADLVGATLNPDNAARNNPLVTNAITLNAEKMLRKTIEENTAAINTQTKTIKQLLQDKKAGEKD